MKSIYCFIFLAIVVVLPFKICIAADLTIEDYVAQINKYWQNRDYTSIKTLYEERLSKNPNDLAGLFTKLQYLIFFGNKNDIVKIEALSLQIKTLGSNKNWGDNLDLKINMKAILYDTEDVQRAISNGALGPGLTEQQLENLHKEFVNFPLENIILQLGKL